MQLQLREHGQPGLCHTRHITRMIGGVVPVLFSTNSQTFPVFPSISLSLSPLLLFSLLLRCGVFCVVACSVLCCCVSLCCVSGVEQLFQVKRMSRGIGVLLISTYCQTINRCMGFFVEPLEHVITPRGQILASRNGDDFTCTPCVHSSSF